MTRSTWLYPWGLASVAAGGASLLVPLYVVALGGGPATLGFLAGIAALGGTVGAYVAGRLADRTGRWCLLGTGSVTGIALGLIGVAVAPDVTGIVLSYGGFWLSFSAASPVFTMLVVQDSVDGERSHRIARLNRVHGYGWAAGLALGTAWTLAAGALFTLSPLASERILLWVCIALGAAGAVTAAMWLPGHTSTPDGTPHLVFEQPIPTTLFPFIPTRLYRRLRRLTPGQFVDRFTPTLATYFLGTALFFAGFGVAFAPLPAYLSDVGFAPTQMYFLFLVAALGSAVAYGSAGRLVARYEIPSLQAGALGLRAAAVLAVPLVQDPGGGQFALAVTLFTVMGLSWAVIVTAAVDHIADLAPPEIRGESLGVYTAMSALAGGIGSLGGGYVAERVGYAPAFAVACGVVLVSVVVILSPERLDLFGALPRSEGRGSGE